MVKKQFTFLTKILSFPRTYILGILIAAAFLRFYQLGQNPPSLFMDEASNGYNAFSILKTGKDEYGNFMPLTFRSFGDYNGAFSVYMLVPSIAVFGLNDFAVRFPSALLGTLTIFVTYLLTKKIAEDLKLEGKFAKEILSLGAALFLAISPWHLQFSRYDHEANFMLSFLIFSLTTFLYSKKNIYLLLLSTIFLGISFNSYHAAKVLVPLIGAAVLLIYRREIFSFKIKLIFPLIVLIIFALPVFLNFKNSLIRGQSVGILNEQEPAHTFVQNYLSHFSPNFLFISGDNIGRHAVSSMGELYVFQIPLIICGLLFILKSKFRHKKLLLCMLLLAPIPAALTKPAPHALRSIFLSIPLSIISAFGLIDILNLKLVSIKKTLAIFLLVTIGLYNFITYLHLYYKHYPKLRARDWQSGYEEMVKYIYSENDKYSTIAISNYFTNPYIFVLFYTKYDPEKYHPQSANKEAFDKYEFFGPSWEKTKAGKALVVTPFWQAHPEKVLHQIYSRDGDLAFTISEEE